MSESETSPRICPSCKNAVLSIRRWMQSRALFGEVRECPNKTVCGYSSQWTQNNSLGQIIGITMQRVPTLTETPLAPTVPGGDA